MIHDQCTLPVYFSQTLPMLRLLSSKSLRCQDFWKPYKPCHVGIHWITLAEYTHRWVPMYPGICHFFSCCFFYRFVLVKIATSSIRVNINWLEASDYAHTANMWCPVSLNGQRETHGPPNMNIPWSPLTSNPVTPNFDPLSRSSLDCCPLLVWPEIKRFLCIPFVLPDF